MPLEKFQYKVTSWTWTPNCNRYRKGIGWRIIKLEKSFPNAQKRYIYHWCCSYVLLEKFNFKVTSLTWIPNGNRYRKRIGWKCLEHDTRCVGVDRQNAMIPYRIQRFKVQYHRKKHLIVLE